MRSLTALAGELESCPGQIDADRTTVAPQPGEIVTGAASAIENTARVAASGVGNKRFDESTEAAEPEMIAFGARGRLQEPDPSW